MIDVNECLNLLNFYLRKHDRQARFVVSGGAAVNLLGFHKGTKDVDVISPEIEKILREAAVYVSEETGAPKNWLNDFAKVYNDQIPKGWEDRIIEVFGGSNLVVMSLSRQDLLSAKLKAYVDRGFDDEDIIALAPTDKEIETAYLFVNSFELSEVELHDLDTFIEELKNERD